MGVRTKTFDCVEMKNAIQRKLSEEWKGLSDEEIRRRVHQRLETSDDELSRWSRSMRDANHEDSPDSS
ncbi:MAG: hypothetical protein HOP29_09575 [Phycisphaerales bacterium]|nr:hypothetical protein [Phycisphaerales bacterium]